VTPRTYSRTAVEDGREVHRTRCVLLSPGRVAVVAYRNGVSQAADGEFVRARFPSLAAWRIGHLLKRQGYRRTPGGRP
jgi:hypothetical protein